MTPTENRWEDVAVGALFRLPGSFTRDDMAAFARLSGDVSAIHADTGFWRANGLWGVIVYGALIVAKSFCLRGMIVPGTWGITAGRRIDFHSPLSLDQATAARVSREPEAGQVIKLKFPVLAGLAEPKLLPPPS